MTLPMLVDMIYRLPIWLVGGVLLAGAACGAVLIEIVARRFLSVEFRHRHNDVTGAMFSIIGVTYAVLLAFVATLAWDGYNYAKSATYAEAEAALDVVTVASAISDPRGAELRDDVVAYVHLVKNAEWPAQAGGRTVGDGGARLAELIQTAFALKPGTADSEVRGALLQAVTRLADARQHRLIATESSVPSVVWIVTVLGGALTIAFSSFLGTPSLRMHLAMAASLAMSGALVLTMILALSNPFRGDLRVSTEPFDHVLAQIGGFLPDGAATSARLP